MRRSTNARWSMCEISDEKKDDETPVIPMLVDDLPVIIEPEHEEPV